jgi:hypothetical protein
MQQGFARELGTTAPLTEGASFPNQLRLSKRRSSLSLADDAWRSQGAGGNPTPGAHSASPQEPSRQHPEASAADKNNPRVGLIEQSTGSHDAVVAPPSTRPAGIPPAGVTQGERA